MGGRAGSAAQGQPDMAALSHASPGGGRGRRRPCEACSPEAAPGRDTRPQRPLGHCQKPLPEATARGTERREVAFTHAAAAHQEAHSDRDKLGLLRLLKARAHRRPRSRSFSQEMSTCMRRDIWEPRTPQESSRRGAKDRGLTCWGQEPRGEGGRTGSVQTRGHKLPAGRGVGSLISLCERRVSHPNT